MFFYKEPFPIESSSCNKIYIKSILTGNNINFPEGIISEDIPFVVRYVAAIKSLGNISKSYYKYRVGRETSITHSPATLKDVHDWDYIYADLARFMKDKKIYNRYILGLFELYCDSISSIYSRLPRNEIQTHTRVFIDSVYQKIQDLFLYNQLSSEDIEMLLRPIVLLKLGQSVQANWYHFGQLSNKRKVLVIAKVLSKKLKIYPLLKPLVDKYRSFIRR